MTTIRVTQNKRGTTIRMKAGKGEDLRGVIAALAGKSHELPDPLGCNRCTHDNCGRFNGPSQVECRAMHTNACARPDQEPSA